MSGLARLGRSLGRAVVRATRRVEVAAGLVLSFGGLVMLREIGDIIAGAQPVSGASPVVPIVLLAVGALVAIGFGVRFIFKGF
jgi:hypothetical protein